MYICKIMSNNFGYIDIILLAMNAGFIILRLRNILGRKTGPESKIYTDFNDKRFETINKKNPSASEMKPGIIKKKAAIAILAPEIISKIGNLF